MSPASRLRRYGLAVLVVAAGAAMSSAIVPFWNDHFLAALVFFPAVTVSAWFGGLGPGLVAVGGSGLAITYFWLPPHYSFAIEQAVDMVGLTIFCLIGVLVAALHEERLREATAIVVELRRSEQRYRTLFEQSVAAMYVVDHGGRLEDCNDALVRLLGYDSKSDLLELRSTSFYVNENDRHRMLTRAQREGTSRNYRTQWRRRDGSSMTVLLNARDRGDGRLQVTAIDISDQVRAETVEREAAQLLAVTRLANAAAHEINNASPSFAARST